MDYATLMDEGHLLLTDGGIETLLIFERGVRLDTPVEAAGLVLDEPGRKALEEVYRDYLQVGARHGIPMQVGTPTFRAGGDRAGAQVERLNRRCVDLLHRVRDECGPYARKVHLAGVLGPAGDAYRPEEALPPDAALAWHRPQAHALAAAGVDLLFAPTFPSAREALGVARAMAETGLPFVVSFVLGGDGRILDGTPLSQAFAAIDAGTDPRPVGYALSCIHHDLARRALQADPEARGRLLGLKANTSRRTTRELVALGRLDPEDPEAFAEGLWGLHRDFGLRMLGGCCGTDASHVAALATRMAACPAPP